MQLVTTIRQMGYGGIAVQQYVVGRVVYALLQSRLKQHHAVVEAERHEARPFEGEQALTSLLEWVASNGCCNHDVHNRLKWSLHY